MIVKELNGYKWGTWELGIPHKCDSCDHRIIVVGDVYLETPDADIQCFMCACSTTGTGASSSYFAPMDLVFIAVPKVWAALKSEHGEWGFFEVDPNSANNGLCINYSGCYNGVPNHHLTFKPKDSESKYCSACAHKQMKKFHKVDIPFYPPSAVSKLLKRCVPKKVEIFTFGLKNLPDEVAEYVTKRGKITQAHQHDDDIIVRDLRKIIRNPWRIPSLRPKDGRDKAVQDFIMICDRAKSQVGNLVGFSGVRKIFLCCQGGKHRSVAIGEIVAERFREKLYPGSEIIVKHLSLEGK